MIECPTKCNVYMADELSDEMYDDLEAGKPYPWKQTELHCFEQDEESDEWKSLIDAIDFVANRGLEEFKPSECIGREAWAAIRLLPKSIGKLKSVKKLNLYRSNLIAIPPEIEEMDSLKEFIPYTSYCLHWFPFEISNCKYLKSSTVSTRALYGNYKYRPPFPILNTEISFKYKTKKCSICKSALDYSSKQAWVSLGVATDVLPLLVNYCSDECFNKIPKSAEGYVSQPHFGGLDIMQPAMDW